MRNTLLIVVGVVLVVSFLGASQSAPVPDDEVERLLGRMLGTWELKLDKSTATFAVPVRNRTVVYERVGDKAVRYTNKGIDADGVEIDGGGMQVLNGQPYPGEGTSSNRTVRRMPVDEFTVAIRITRDGEPWLRLTQVFSADGQRLTVIHRSVEQAQEPIGLIEVYDKVAPASP